MENGVQACPYSTRTIGPKRKSHTRSGRTSRSSRWASLRSAFACCKMRSSACELILRESRPHAGRRTSSLRSRVGKEAAAAVEEHGGFGPPYDPGRFKLIPNFKALLIFLVHYWDRPSS